jgi:formate hydrogenlyase subunit 7
MVAVDDRELTATAEMLRTRIQRLFGRSLHVRHVDAGSCNACESEIKLLTSPYYDVHRLGIFFTSSPRLVVAVGACACDGGIFGPSALTRGGLAHMLPVDAFIPGCPPAPLTLIHGLLVALGRAEPRLRAVHWRVHAEAVGIDPSGGATA